MKHIALVVLIAGSLLPVGLLAQTPLPGAAGLGRRLRPLDARARALGGTAVALHGDNLSAVNPAAAASFSGPGITASIMPESRSVAGPGIDGDVDVSDFPLFRIGLPVSQGWALGVTFGGFLDQDWSVQFIDTLRLSTGDLDFQETRVSEGGVSQLRLEVARSTSERLSIGVAGIIYRGEVRRSVERLFPRTEVFEPYDAVTAIQYTGWGLAAGVEFRPVEEMRLGATAGWGPGLRAADDSTGAEVDLDLPLTLDVGGSWLLTSDLLFALGLGWEGWSVVEDRRVTGGMSDALRIGAGLELRAASGLENALFLRAGGRIERLPFKLRGGAPVERAVGLGAGLEFRGGRGRFDAALELGKRGDRQDHGVEESFTRLTFSVSVFAN